MPDKKINAAKPLRDEKNTTDSSTSPNVNFEFVSHAKMTMADKLAKLTAPIPEQYLETYTEDGLEFTGYKAQYAINLLNEVFGLSGWFAKFNLEKIENIRGAWLAYGVVKIYLKDKTVEILADGIGGSYAKRFENALKGAKTSAFKNACRYLGIGGELYLAGHDDDIVVKDDVKAADNTAAEEPLADVPNEIKAVIDNIEKAQATAELEAVLPIISKTEGKAIKELLINKYNNKKVLLAEKNG